MPQIKHIAIATNDAAKTAKFYSEVFGLREVAQLDGENAKGFMLSDGNVNMAILDFQSDAVAGERGKDWEGIHHIGFEVESLEEIEARLVRRQFPADGRSQRRPSHGQHRPPPPERRDQVHGPQRRNDRRLPSRLDRDPRLRLGRAAANQDRNKESPAYLTPGFFVFEPIRREHNRDRDNPPT